MERLILDHPVAQRLRYVRQNGLGHLVFPEANSSRFAHSLGTMHLASRFFRALLANSAPGIRDSFVSAIAKGVDEAAGPVSGYTDSMDVLPPAAVACIRAYVESAANQSQIKIAEQALRLAALFHDLGHLPFSHDFEEGLDGYWDSLTSSQRTSSPFAPLFREARRTGEKLHERLGHGLALVLFNEVFGSLSNSSLRECVRVAFDFAYRILTEAPRRPANENEAALTLMHSLIDGELDVDRGDYILRDGRNYGFEFARYDLDRLVDNLRLARLSNQYHLAVRAHGLTALETFLLARYRSYENAVRHHKVAQVGAALRYSIALSLKRFKENKEMDQFMEDVGTIGGLLTDPFGGAQRKEILSRFAGYDDGWQMQWLRRLLTKGEDVWVAVACRRSPAQSLWKRPDDFRALVGGSIAAWNQGLPDWQDDTQLADWNREVRRLLKDGVLVIRHRFQPWTPDPLNNDDSSLLVETSNGEYSSVNRASAMVDSLRPAWDDAVQIHAFVSEGSAIHASDVIKRLPRFEKEEGS